MKINSNVAIEVGTIVLVIAITFIILAQLGNITPSPVTTTHTLIENFEAPDVNGTSPDGLASNGVEFYSFAADIDLYDVTNATAAPKFGLQGWYSAERAWDAGSSAFTFIYPDVCPAYTKIQYRFAIDNTTSNQSTNIDIVDCSSALIVRNNVTTITWNNSGTWQTNISCIITDWDGTVLITFTEEVDMSLPSELYMFQAEIDYSTTPNFQWTVGLYWTEDLSGLPVLIEENVSQLTCDNPELLYVSGAVAGSDTAVYLDNVLVTYDTTTTGAARNVTSDWALIVGIIILAVIISILVLAITSMQHKKKQ